MDSPTEVSPSPTPPAAKPIVARPRGRFKAFLQTPWVIGVAQIGYGLSKALILGGAMQRIADPIFEAAPAALQVGTAWYGAAAFVLQLYFWFGGVLDICSGLARLLGQRVTDGEGDAFLARHPANTLRFWPLLPFGKGQTMLRSWPALLLIPAVAALYAQPAVPQLAWMGLYVVLILLAMWPVTARILGWLPRLFQVALTLPVTLMSFVLLRSGSFEQVLHFWRVMWQPPAATLQAYLLEVQLYDYLPITLFVLAFATALSFPRVSLIMQQPEGLAVFTGLGVGALTLLTCTTRLPLSDDVVTGLPRHLVQTTLVNIFDAGNDEVYVGNSPWLFQPEELKLLTQPTRSTATLDALEQLAKELQKRQIPLLVVSVPGKTTLYPDGLLPGYDKKPLPLAVRLQAHDRLKAAGAEVLDLTDTLWNRREKMPSYLHQSTLWTFDVMKETSLLTARQVRQKWPKQASVETPGINATIFDRSDVGDLAYQLDPWMPEAYHPAQMQHLVAIQRLEPEASSPVIFIGGAFAEIYDAPELNFGPEERPSGPQAYRAAFPAHLATQLGRTLDARTTIDASPLRVLKELLSPEGLAALQKEDAEKKLVIYLLTPPDFLPHP